MKKKSKGTMLIISFLVLMAIGALSSFYFISEQNMPLIWKSKIIDIPLIKTTVISSSDNMSHDLKIKFSLGVDKSIDDKELDNEVLKMEIVSIISELDYNKIAKKDGLDYIKSEVKSQLDKENTYLDFLYITDIQANNFQMFDFDVAAKETKKERVFKSLFPSMR